MATNAQGEWSRRNFLSARGLGVCAGGLLHELLPETPAARRLSEPTLSNLCVSRRAMACEFSIYLPPNVAQPLDAANAALDAIEAMEELLTVYSGSSLMSYVNQHAARKAVHLDQRILRILEIAAELARQTDHAFDVATGRLIRAWGFLHGPRRVPSQAEIDAALRQCGMQHVQLDVNNCTARYTVDGLEINLGSIGKGYAIDRAMTRIRDEFGVTCALMQGGTSSMAGMGSPAGDGQGWMVGIQNPFDASRLVATVRVRDRALGTSGTAHQYFVEDGRRYGHILDPRTGRPADGLASVSVLAKDAATADALATALFVMGLDKARTFCHNHPQVAALLVLKSDAPDPASSPPQVLTFNLAARDVNLRVSQDSA